MEQFTEHEAKVLRQIVQSLDEINSNGTFAKYAVLHLRNHPSSGVSQAELDALEETFALHRHRVGRVTTPPF